MTETRKLAAILVADIVGYSRLAGADEDRILARLRALRSDLIDPTIAVHQGRTISFLKARFRLELHDAFLTGRTQWTDAHF
jgi:class 3 adenylate cyclase